MATDEGSLLAAARAEGKVLVAPGTEIALTKPLLVYQGEFPSWMKKEDYHCERRPSSDPRAAVGGWG